MIKQLGKHDHLISPFIAARKWVLSNVDPQELVLTDTTGSEEPVALEFADYTNGTPFVNRECNIALEQQAGDLAIPEAGKKGSGTFFPNLEETNQKTKTFQRLVYDQIQKAFYNDYKNPLQIFGIDNIDFPLSKMDRFIGNEFLMFTIPRNVFGDRLTENTIQMFDHTFDDNLVIADDGEGNLIAGLNLFSKVQEIRIFGNNVFSGSIICDSPIWEQDSNFWEMEDSTWDGCGVHGATGCATFGPPSDPSHLVVVSGSAILTWNDNSNNEDGFVVERSLDGVTYTQYVTKSANTETYTDQNVTQSNTYWYRIFAFNSVGTSNYTNTASITFTSSTGSVGPDPLAWWAMGESGSLDRIDAVNSIHFKSFSTAPGFITRASGKVGNATKFSTAVFGDADMENTTDTAAPDITSGFHFVAWVAWDSWDSNTWFYIFSNSIEGTDGNIIALWQASTNEILVVQDANNPHAGDFSVSFTPTPGQFYFINLFWDASDQKYGIQIDNGTATKSSVATPIVGTPTGIFIDTLLIFNNNLGNPSSAVTRLDEYGIYGKKLNNTQLTFLYNTGSGQTWPFTLPS